MLKRRKSPVEVVEATRRETPPPEGAEVVGGPAPSIDLEPPGKKRRLPSLKGIGEALHRAPKWVKTTAIIGGTAAVTLIGANALNKHDNLPNPMTPPATTRTTTPPARTADPNAAASPATGVAPATGRITGTGSARRPFISAPSERRLPIQSEIDRIGMVFKTFGYGGSNKLVVETMEQNSARCQGKGKLCSMPFTQSPSTPAERAIALEWSAAKYVVEHSGMEDTQNPPLWYTADEWNSILGPKKDRESAFSVALLAKESAVLTDIENQRSRGFRGGAYVVPDDAYAVEIVFNQHRIPLAGVAVKSSREARMDPNTYDAHVQKFVDEHGDKQTFKYNANGKTTVVDGWRDLAMGVIHLSPDVEINDVEVQKLSEQYGPAGDVEVAGVRRQGWIDRNTNTVIAVGADGTIKTIRGVRLPPRAAMSTPSAPITADPNAPGITDPNAVVPEPPLTPLGAVPSTKSGPAVKSGSGGGMKLEIDKVWSQIDPNSANTTSKKYLTRQFPHVIRMADGSIIGADEIRMSGTVATITSNNLIWNPEGKLSLSTLTMRKTTDQIEIDPPGEDKVERTLTVVKTAEEIRKETDRLKALAEQRGAEFQYRDVGLKHGLDRASQQQRYELERERVRQERIRLRRGY